MSSLLRSLPDAKINKHRYLKCESHDRPALCFRFLTNFLCACVKPSPLKLTLLLLSACNLPKCLGSCEVSLIGLSDRRYCSSSSSASCAICASACVAVDCSFRMPSTLLIESETNLGEKRSKNVEFADCRICHLS